MSAAARVLAPLRRAVANLLSRAVVRLVDDSAKMQALQVEATASDVLEQVEHWQPYGYTAHPHPGAEALLVSLGGSRARPVVLACADRRYRVVGLAAGEVALYDDLGQSLILRRDGVHISAARIVLSGDLELHGALSALGGLDVQGDLTVSGTVDAAEDCVGGGVSLVGHRHPHGTPNTGTPIL